MCNLLCHFRAETVTNDVFPVNFATKTFVIEKSAFSPETQIGANFEFRSCLDRNVRKNLKKREN